MAIYHLNMQSISRSNGSSAVSAAAYRAGERIRDLRTGRTYDHRQRQGVLHSQIVLPSHLEPSRLNWAQDRAYLWNAAERAENRRDSRVAREYLVALPHEMNDEQRLRLARDFSQELADRYKFALDLAIHAARDYPGSDPRNFHAHLLATTREVAPAGFTSKTTVELRGTRRQELGLGPGIQELLHVRERWAALTNEALRAAHIEARIDHRSLAAQGIDREPLPRLSRAAFEMQRRGQGRGEAARLRTAGTAGTSLREQIPPPPSAEAALESARKWAQMRQAMLDQPGQTPRELAQQSAANWLKMREKFLDGTAKTARQAGRSHDNDYSL